MQARPRGFPDDDPPATARAGGLAGHGVCAKAALRSLNALSLLARTGESAPWTLCDANTGPSSSHGTRTGGQERGPHSAAPQERDQLCLRGEALSQTGFEFNVPN